MPVMEDGAASEDLAHHSEHVIGLERRSERLVAHAASGRVGHLTILQMIARIRTKIVIAAMVVMEVADNDACHLLRRDAKRGQSVAHRLDQFALAAAAHSLIEAGIDKDRSRWPDDCPDIEVEWLQHVVRVAADEILRR